MAGREESSQSEASSRQVVAIQQDLVSKKKVAVLCNNTYCNSSTLETEAEGQELKFILSYMGNSRGQPGLHKTMS